MNLIKVVVYCDDKSKVDALWNEINNIPLNWQHPSHFINPTLTTSTGSPWYILSMSICDNNLCTVPETFLSVMDDNEIQYLPENEYYEKQESYSK